eukprot:3679572-Alexandrium_andersonii.AAC.1
MADSMGAPWGPREPAYNEPTPRHARNHWASNAMTRRTSCNGRDSRGCRNTRPRATERTHTWRPDQNTRARV